MSLSLSSLDEDDPNAHHSTRTPLLADTTSVTPGSSIRRRSSQSHAVAALPSPSHAHIIVIIQPCCLLDTPPPVRSLMLDYMDDHTAIRYLSTCQMLHAGYHEYPLKRAMSVATFKALPQLNVYDGYMCQTLLYGAGYLCVLIIGVLLLMRVRNRPLSLAVVGVLAALFFVYPYLGLRWRLAIRTDCCGTELRLRKWRGWRMMPRVTRLKGELRNLTLLPHLKHLTELEVRSYEHNVLGKQWPLPHSLRTLRLRNSRFLTLTPDTLPPHLTSLTLGAVKDTLLPLGVLPQSLTSLYLTSGFSTELPIGEGVLPACLQRLKVDEWTQPLSHIALPASLTNVVIHRLSDHPLPALPSHIQCFAVGGAFNQPLNNVLPAGLRVLRLTGKWEQPLTAHLFACTPQLEELWLSDKMPFCELAASVLPRSLRVLRLGLHHSLVIPHPLDKPPELHRVLVTHTWEDERMLALWQLGLSCGFKVALLFSVEGYWVERELDEVMHMPVEEAG